VRWPSPQSQWFALRSHGPMKERSWINGTFPNFWASPRPRGSASRRSFYKADRDLWGADHCFLLLETVVQLVDWLVPNFWGQPQTPWLRFAEVLLQSGPRPLGSRPLLFASFSRKRRTVVQLAIENVLACPSFIELAPNPIAPFRGGPAKRNVYLVE
jgi:hypothetical protein